jgi:FlaA1/EpsC-like NDP-sugar epimerase/lipopolysaccharide/colanic/teichoic acid biosynthesis glycosyltransferase
MAKRAFDLAVAVAGLILLSPLLVAGAVFILLDSGPPVVHRGWRMGRDGREFAQYRLRTMVRGARHQGPGVTVRNDPRITRAGNWLRRWGIDRIPELFNVIRGDMSLVGPAPEDPTYVSLYTPEQRRVLGVRPGVVGPGSIAFADEERLLWVGGGDAAYMRSVLPVKVDLDLAYIRDRSWWGDLKILCRVLGVELAQRHFGPGSLLLDAITVVGGFWAALLVISLDSPATARADAAALNDTMLPLVVLWLVGSRLARLHRRVWTPYPAPPDLVAAFLAAAASTAVTVLVLPVPRGLALLGGTLTLAGMLAVRFAAGPAGALRNSLSTRGQPRIRTLIYGAGETGQAVAWRLVTGREGRSHHLVGFLDDDPAKLGLRIHGVEVLGPRSQLVARVDVLAVDLVILALGQVGGERLREVVAMAQETPAQIKIATGMADLISSRGGQPLVREVKVEDLLGRRPYDMHPRVAAWLQPQRLLVTGASGSIGLELCRQLASFEPRELIALDNNETGIYELELELRNRMPDLRLTTMVADVTDKGRIRRLFEQARPDVIFHVAAYKHVPLMERHPGEAVRVNIGGTRSVLDAARRCGAARLVLVSTDKAVNPSSVMGATKRVAEMLLTTDGDIARPLCTAVRFGNVLGSRGSVVPTFARQIELGGPVTITHPEMTRYFMDSAEAATLILEAAHMTTGGDIFMLDMGERIRIADLARRMIRMRGLRPDVDIPIVYSGVRPGEKLHEELIYPGESWEEAGHRLIHRVRSPVKAPRVQTEEDIEELLRLAEAGDDRRLVELLGELAGLKLTGADAAPSPLSGGSVSRSSGRPRSHPRHRGLTSADR